MNYGFAILTHLRWYCSPTPSLKKSKTGITYMERTVSLAIRNIRKIHMSYCRMWVVRYEFENDLG